MFCVKCGKQLSDNMSFCIHCGTPTGKGQPSAVADPMETITADVVDSSQDRTSFVSEDQVSPQPNAQPADYQVFENQQLTCAQAPLQPNQSNNGTGQQRNKKVPAIVAASCAAVAVAALAVIVFARGFGGLGAASSGGVEDASSSGSQTVVVASNKYDSEDDASTSSEDGNAVTLEVKTIDGETLSGEVRRDDNDYVLSESSIREYSYGEISDMGLSDAELCIAWNEPFARQGYHFKNPDLQHYFDNCSWYVDAYNSSALSGVAATNNTTLRSIAESNPQSAKWMDLATS